jgi:hypothetical protein
LSPPSIDNLALALDQIDVHVAGVQLAGRADAGQMLAWGRQLAMSSSSGVVIQTTKPNPVYMRFDWQPSLSSIDVSCPAPWVVIRDHAASTFWSSTYDDLDPNAFLRDTVTIKPGDSIMVAPLSVVTRK